MYTTGIYILFIVANVHVESSLITEKLVKFFRDQYYDSIFSNFLKHFNLFVKILYGKWLNGASCNFFLSYMIKEN